MRAYYYTFMSVAFPLGNNDGVDRVASYRNQRNGLVQVSFTGWTPSASSNNDRRNDDSSLDEAGGNGNNVQPPSSSPLFRDVSLIMKRVQFQKAVPIKIKAIHGCSPDAFTGKIISPLVRPLMSFHSTSRIRIHYGMSTLLTCFVCVCLFFVVITTNMTWLPTPRTLQRLMLLSKCNGPHLQIQYELLKYGIPPTACPVEHNGSGGRNVGDCWTNQYQKDWVKEL